MEKPPLYEEFKGVGKIMTTQIKSGFRNHEWGWLLGYFIACVIVIAVGMAGSISLFGAAQDQWHKWFPKLETSMAPMTLRYDMATTTKDGDGIYHTDFKLFVHVPAGNNRQTITLYNNFPLKDSSCLLYSAPLQQIVFAVGLTSTTSLYRTSCTSREKIIDTGNLFQVAP